MMVWASCRTTQKYFCKIYDRDFSYFSHHKAHQILINDFFLKLVSYFLAYQTVRSMKRDKESEIGLSVSQISLTKFTVTLESACNTLR